MAEYRLSPAAQDDLEQIWRYTRKQWSVEQADRYVGSLVQAFQRLAQAPQTAAQCDFIRSGYRRWRVERHVIYLRVTDYGIAVIRVLHQAMDVTLHLP